MIGPAALEVLGSIKWGCWPEVKYPPDSAYQNCMKNKAQSTIAGLGVLKKLKLEKIDLCRPF